MLIEQAVKRLRTGQQLHAMQQQMVEMRQQTVNMQQLMVDKQQLMVEQIAEMQRQLTKAGSSSMSHPPGQGLLLAARPPSTTAAAAVYGPSSPGGYHFDAGPLPLAQSTTPSGPSANTGSLQQSVYGPTNTPDPGNVAYEERAYRSARVVHQGNVPPLAMEAPTPFRQVKNMDRRNLSTPSQEHQPRYQRQPQQQYQPPYRQSYQQQHQQQQQPFLRQQHYPQPQQHAQQQLQQSPK
ncbi:unnamed protein product [Discula destructiva]